jgi:hypothetical protein
VNIFPSFTVTLAFAFFAYQLLLLYDTLAHENTIQVLSLCLYDSFLFIYSELQLKGFKQALVELNQVGAIDLDIWIDTRSAVLTIAIMTGVCTFWTCFVSWKLYEEFAWTLFKFVQADTVLRRRYLVFQVSPSICLNTLLPASGTDREEVLYHPFEIWLVLVHWIPHPAFDPGVSRERRMDYHSVCDLDIAFLTDGWVVRDSA